MPFDFLVRLSQPVLSITGTTSLSSTDFGRMHVCTGTSANYTVTLPSPTNNSGGFIGFIMDGGLTKLVTIAQNASETIDGATSRVMWANEIAILYCDGTNWIKIGGKSTLMACQMYPAGSTTVPNTTFTPVLVDSVTRDNTGAMADTTNHQIKIVRPGAYSISALAIWNNVNPSINTQLRVERNGTGESSEALVPFASASYPSMNVNYINSACAVGDVFTFSVYQQSGSSSSIPGTAINANLIVTELTTW